MAGTLTISTLSDGTNSTSSTNCIKGSAKAWVNFDGATGSARASYNVTSVTRTAAGLYTITFTNPMSDTNYAVVTGGDARSGYANMEFGINYGGTKTVSAVQMFAISFAGATGYDEAQASVAIFR